MSYISNPHLGLNVGEIFVISLQMQFTSVLSKEVNVFKCFLFHFILVSNRKWTFNFYGGSRTAFAFKNPSGKPARKGQPAFTYRPQFLNRSSSPAYGEPTLARNYLIASFSCLIPVLCLTSMKYQYSVWLSGQPLEYTFFLSSLVQYDVGFCVDAMKSGWCDLPTTMIHPSTI